MVVTIRVFVLIAFMLPAICPGQGIYSNALVKVEEMTFVKIMGNITNAGQLQNNGTIAVTGNLRNQMHYQDSLGEIRLIGPVNQEINFHGDSVSHLIVRGGGEKILSDSLYISNRLRLDEGIINTENGSYLQVNENTIIEGGGFDSFVSGSLFREGTGDLFFPIGRYGYYYPVELQAVEGNNLVIGLAYYEPNPSPLPGTNVSRVSSARYWELSRERGEYEGGLITLLFDPLDSIQNLETAVIAEADSVSTRFRSLGASLQTGSRSEGTVTSETAALASVFAIAEEIVDPAQGILYVPNAFSPTSATEEDDRYLRVYGENITPEGFVFKVYNKWGAVVYETTSFQEANLVGWNGLHYKNATELPSGVYTYLVNGRYAGGNPFSETGTVTLLK